MVRKKKELIIIDGVKHKECSKCGELKTLNEYSKHGINKDASIRYRSECKICESKYRKGNKDKMSKYNKEYYQKNKEERNKQKKEYREKNKEKIAKYNKDYYKNNREREIKRHREYYQNNKEYFKRYSQSEYGKEVRRRVQHKRRVLKKSNGGTYTLEQWNECLEFFDYRCAYTGEELIREKTHVEHIQAISKGGTNYIWNICPSINYANLSKNSKDLEEWYKKQPYFSEERLNKIYEWIEYAENKYKENELIAI